MHIGSAVDIAQRFRQHRNKDSIHKGNNSKLYNLINKHGWDSIEFGIVEKVSFTTDGDNENRVNVNKRLLSDREQYYLDKYSPSLNLNVLAGYMMEYKHTDKNKLKFSVFHKGKSYLRGDKIGIGLRPLPSNDTIVKLKLRSRGVVVCMCNKCNELVKEFRTIKHAGKFVGLSLSSVSKHIIKGTLWNNPYRFKVK